MKKLSAFIKKLAAFITAMLATSAASFLHGRNFVSKGILIAGLAIIHGGLAWWLSLHWLGAVAGAAVSAAFWFAFRTGRQAAPELDYMYGVEGAKLAGIERAYYFPIIGVSVLLTALAYYGGNPWFYGFIPLCWLSLLPLLWAAENYRQDPGENEGDNRKMVEIVTPWAINSASLLVAVGEGVRGWA